MRGVPVEEGIRLLQIFLSPTGNPGPGIFEVCIKPGGALTCTCSGYNGRKTCKHTRFVQSRIDSHGGTYPHEISTRTTPEDAQKAEDSDEAFRDFIIKFGKIEVF